MKPKSFDYVRVDTLPALFAALGAHDNAKIVAGGQSLVPMMNFRVAQPEVLVDINGVEALRHVVREGAVLRIGALARYRDVIDSPLVRDSVPLLVAALGHVGYPAIRNRGTLGGSVVHNDPSAETGVALCCLGAELVVASAEGERVVPIAEFFVTTYLTDIAPHEVLAELRIPVPAPRTGYAFREVAKRVGDFAIVNVAALVAVDTRGATTAVSLALGGVAETPVAVDVGAALLGRPLDAARAAEAARLVDAAIDPQDDNVAGGEYKRHLAGVLVKQALLAAHEDALAKGA
ncbi:MAG: xanthine dehydrogenase family protein subunit M [Gammaproteobacteria bacterium]|nr:xanthine dehydrogenase family protein subunit M [Gammaproteobacteria bacterium]